MLEIKPQKLILLLLVSLFVFASAADQVHFRVKEIYAKKGGSDNIFANGFEVPGTPSVNYSSDSVAEITDIPSTEINSHLVGSISGGFQTDQMGQANYAISILAASGTAGLAPQVSLNYSSASGNGQLGMGWSLSGTTLITRCRETQESPDSATQVVIKPTTWNTQDRLCLNGQRMYLSSGAGYWEDGATYRTEKDQFARITYLATTDSFTIERKDGSISFYGDTADSAIQATDIAGSPTYAWLISRFKDNMSNYIDYTYQQFGDLEFALIDIDYTGHIGNGTASDMSHATYNNLSFIYENTRTDKTIAYISGAKVSMTRRLASIESSIDGVNVRAYTLNYQNSTTTNRSLITSISECRGINDCLPITTFDWEQASKTYQSTNTATGSFPTGLESSKLGDINADSRADLIFTDSSNTFKVAKANGESGFGSVVSTGIAAPTGSIINDKWHLIDYNADGLQDLMVTGASFWQIYLANSSGTNFSNSPINTSIAVTNNDDFQIVDMNGDGLADLLYGDNNGQLSVRYLQKQASGFVFSSTQTPILLPFSPSAFPEITGLPSGLNFMEYRFKSQSSINIRTHDINGDGVADMILQSEVFHENIGGTLNVAQYKFKSKDEVNIRGGSSFVSSHWIAFINTGTNGAGSINFDSEYYYLDKIADTSSNTGIKMRFADVNSDGLTDIVSYQSPNWSFRLANGKGYEPKQNIGSITQSTGNFNNQVTLNDCNNDGMLDILFPADFSNHPYYCRLWTGSNFSVNFQTDAHAINIDTNSNFFMDVNGDGRIDHFRIDSAGAQKIYPQTQSYQTTDKIKTITNGLGAVTSIDYKPLTFSSLYLQGIGGNQLNFGNNSPVFDYLSSMYVVQMVTADTPTQADPQHTTTMQYQYKNARVQTGGRGFLGFEKIITSIPVKSTNQAQDYILQTQTSYSQEFPYVGLPKTVIVKQLEVAPIIPPVCSGNDNCFPDPCLPSQVNCTPFLLAVNRAPTATVTLSETINSFDKFNTDGTVGVTTGKAQFGYIKDTIEKTYAPVGGALLKTRVQTTNHDSYGNPIDNTVKIYNGTYDANNPSTNLLHTTITTNTYDNLTSNWKIGLLRSSTTTVASPSKPSLTTLMEYDYDSTTGLLSEERRLPNDNEDKFLRVLHQYDNFGNEVKTISCSGSDFTNAQCSDTSTLANDVPTNANDTLIHRYNQLEFDTKGRYANIIKNSLDQIVSTINSRDIYGNPTSTTDLLGTTTTNTYDIFGTAQTSYSSLGSWTYASKKWCSNLTGSTVDASCPTTAVIRVTNRASGGSLSYDFIDKLGRNVQQVARSFNDINNTSTIDADERWVVTNQYYDTLGRGNTSIGPYFYGETDNANKPQNTTEYDRYNRITKVTLADGSTQSIAYNGFVTTTTNALNQTKTETKNALGELIQVEDNLGTLLNYSYNAQGLVTDIKRTINEGTANELIELLIHNDYDKLGRKTQSSDVDTGITTSQYNAEGEIIKVQDAKFQSVRTYRDELGRVELTEIFEGLVIPIKKLSTSQVYDPNTNQIQSEIELLGPDAFRRDYNYDNLKRLSSITTSFTDIQNVCNNGGDCTYINSIYYDQYSRSKIEQDASTKATENHYNAQGYLERVTNADDATQQYYKINATDKFGNISQDTKAGNLITDYSFDKDRGFMTNIQTTGLSQNIWYNYSYNQLGNLRKRADIQNINTNQGQSECFYYDGLNRLIENARHNSFGVNCGTPPVPVEQNLVSYDDKGNILTKDNQTYSYLNANATTIVNSPHQVTSKGSQIFTYDANGNNTQMTNFLSKNNTFQTRHIDYNTFNKVERLWLGNDPNNPATESLYKYDTSRQKYARIDNENGTSKATYFIGNVEIEYNGGTVKYKRQLGNYAIITEQGTSTTEAYLFTDHLGSVDTITDANGNNLQKMSFSAWGERRLANNWQAISVPTLREQLDGYTNRGYTGHEMVDAFGIINMGGRIYDAALGRMLQADPFVQDPTNTQSYNRYTYVFNNPLSYTDPSGYFSLRQALGIVVGAVVGFFTAGAGFHIFWVGFLSGFTSAIIITGNLKSALKTGLIAGALAFAGNGFSGETPFTEAANAAGDAAGGTGNAITQTAQSGAIANAATQAATRAALKQLVKDIVSQIAQSIDPEFGAAVSFLANSGNYKGVSPGGILRNLTSKYGNLKASQELERFAEKNGLTLGELNLFLLTSSFLGNKIVGTRFYEDNFLGTTGDERAGDQGIEGILSRDLGTGFIDSAFFNRPIGLFFDVVDITLGYQGLITASGYDAIKNGDSSRTIQGFSLGSLDANNLVSRGYFPSGIVKSLVFGNIGNSNVDVIIGAGDIVNGFFFGKIFNPFATLKTEHFGCALHEISGCY